LLHRNSFFASWETQRSAVLLSPGRWNAIDWHILTLRTIISAMSEHVIRAAYSERTIRVYQAYRPEVAIPALAAGRFVPPFKMGRMTWIKPSFNWMMYRSGYASKSGQEVILGVDITREGFEWALKNATLSTFTPGVHSSPEMGSATLYHRGMLKMLISGRLGWQGGQRSAADGGIWTSCQREVPCLLACVGRPRS